MLRHSSSPCGLNFSDWLQLSVYVHVLTGFGCWACVFWFRTIEDTRNAIAISLDCLLLETKLCCFNLHRHVSTATCISNSECLHDGIKHTLAVITSAFSARFFQCGPSCSSWSSSLHPCPCLIGISFCGNLSLSLAL